MVQLKLNGRNKTGLTIKIISRSLKLTHFDRSQQLTSIKEGLAYCDYSIMKRQNNYHKVPLKPATSLTSLAYFIRNIKSTHITHVRNTNTSKNESFFTLLLYSLHYYSGPPSERFISYEIQNTIDKTLENCTHESILRRKNRVPSFNSKVSQLVSLYIYGDTTFTPSIPTKPSVPPIELKNIEAALLSLVEFVKEYDYQEILRWISCITAPSIIKAYQSLDGLYKVPDFLILDILGRSPQSEHEVGLLINLCDLSGVDLPVETIHGIINHIKLYNHELLPIFTSQLIHSQKFGSDDFNKLIVILSESQNTASKVHFQTILKSQRMIVEKLQSINGSLSTLGTLGICYALSYVSQDKAERLFHTVYHDISTKKERQMHNLLRLKLSQNPQHLIQNIDSMNHKDTRIWDEFVIQAEEFSIINKENSRTLLKKHDHDLFAEHSQSILQKHLNPAEIIELGNEMDNKSIATLMKKLYTDPEVPIGHFKSKADYARYIFKVIDTPSRQIVGRVLVGESYLNPQSSYLLYETLLAKYCNNEPNEKCLLSLIGPALRNPRLKWGSRYAAQIAVHEFRKHVKIESSYVPQTRLLTPSNELWCSYILLCGKSSYQDELAEVLPTWETLKFIPSRKALGMLLGALPLGTAERIKHHASTFLTNSGCTEANPLESVHRLYKWPTDAEIHYWREKMKP